jgi:nucleotide-binding universal stress UspA family protein
MAPIDFSDNSFDSLQVAASLARAAGVDELTAPHVFFDASTVRYAEHRDEICRNEERAFVDFIAPLERKDVEIHPLFVEGNNVGRTLLHVIEQHQPDLIVMNTRGRSRAASVLLGSVTTQVMISTPAAILAVKHFGAMMHLFDVLRESRFWDRPNPKTN